MDMELHSDITPMMYLAQIFNIFKFSAYILICIIVTIFSTQGLSSKQPISAINAMYFQSVFSLNHHIIIFHPIIVRYITL